MITVKLSRKNQIAVPAAVRRQLGIGPGDRLVVAVKDKKIILQPQVQDPLEHLLDLAPEIWCGVDGAEYVRELREEWSHREA